MASSDSACDCEGPWTAAARVSGSRVPTRRALGPLAKWLTGPLVALLVACGTPTAEPAADGLTVLLPRAPFELDPRLSGDAYGHKISRLLFASLVRIDATTLEPVPDLAAQIEQPAPTHYRVTLRPGLHFSDGSALDTADVAATYRSVVDPRLGSRYASTYRRIQRVVVEGPLTVSFHLDGPHATFLTDLELPILRAEDELRPIAQPGGPRPAGAGPYVLMGFAAGHLSLRANPHWYAGSPRFAALEMRVIRDDNTRALRLLAGAGDVALNGIPPLLLPMFVEHSGYAVRSAPGIGTTYIGVNTEAKALADLRVRRAISLAIDRERIVEHKLNGRAQVARTWIPPGHWAFDDGVPPPTYDPAMSRALLRQAGYGDGLSLVLRCGSDRFRVSLARVLKAMLAEVGIALSIRPSETATLLKDLGRGRFELTLMQVPEVIEPHVLSWFFGSDRIPSATSDGANRWRLRSPALDAALERGRKHAGRAVRIEAYHQVQRILARELPVISLWHDDVVAVTAPEAAAFAVPRSGRFDTFARSPR